MEEKIRPIDVISICSADGQIRPLRFRIEDEAHQLRRVDIDEVISVKEVPSVWMETNRWLVELKYTVRTHTWCLMRKVI